MKRLLQCGFWAALIAIFAGCAPAEKIDLASVDSFSEAIPVWAQGREKEKNLTLSFREVISTGRVQDAYIRIAASTDYRLRVNGEFVAHGPSVAAHDFYRVDCYDLKPYLKRGENLLALEVAGYNESSYYLLNQPSFLQAEVEVNGEVIAATGKAFEAYDLGQRKADVERFSFQRPFVEYYTLAPDFEKWAKDLQWQGTAVTLTEQEAKTLLARKVEYPDYKMHKAEAQGGNIYKFACNSTGFLGAKVVVSEPTELKIAFDELLDAEGRVDEARLICKPYVTYNLQPGEYTVESFEPYTMQYAEVKILSGKAEVQEIFMRDYCNADVHRGAFLSDNEAMNFLFETARETCRQNSLDIFMDCPSRERAGWLCDSFFTARTAFDLSGNTKIEKNFLENFLLPERFKDIDEGMLPMCYPSDHWNHNYIPNWAMWFVVQLEEYLYRSGDRELVDRAKKRVYDLIDYFKPFLNKDGMLEKLSHWVFVEWSAANNYVQDVNYPSNMLYAYMLDVAGRLYNDNALMEQAEKMRATIREQAFDGEYFIDNAKRTKSGKLELTGNHTEVCQYYAFYFGVATPESHPELWSRLRDEFGPARKQTKAYADVPFANAFIGNYLRMELLSREGLSRKILDESIDFYIPMAEQTGTLWENMTSVASCNHGFASHIIRVLNRDVLGVYALSPVEKKVTLRFVDCGLKSCQGSIPVGEESVDIEWSIENGKIEATLALPEGYTYECLPGDLEVALVSKTK